MEKIEKENVLVSACLLGFPVRWHGKKLYKSSFIKKFEKENPNVRLIPICPEILGGLGVPRAPVKRRKGRVFATVPQKELRKFYTGKDLTKFFEKGAQRTLEMAKRLKVKRVIFTNWSPSCDKNGFTGKLLREKGIDVINTW